MSNAMDFTIKREADELVIAVSGRLDAKSSAELEPALVEAVAADEHVIFDLAQLDYISSAGLRILLATSKRLAKSGGSMTLVNVGDDVMDVLRASGFSEIFDIG